jgi:hypothetical protein
MTSRGPVKPLPLPMLRHEVCERSLTLRTCHSSRSMLQVYSSQLGGDPSLGLSKSLFNILTNAGLTGGFEWLQWPQLVPDWVSNMDDEVCVVDDNSAALGGGLILLSEGMSTTCCLSAG